MAEDCNYQIHDLYGQDRRLFFLGRSEGEESELMLRYGKYDGSDLTVARICFIHKRSGYMTKLFEALKHIKETYHLDKIVIESVATDEMRAWCQKNNFIPCGNPESIVNWEYA